MEVSFVFSSSCPSAEPGSANTYIVSCHSFATVPSLPSQLSRPIQTHHVLGFSRHLTLRVRRRGGNGVVVVTLGLRARCGFLLQTPELLVQGQPTRTVTSALQHGGCLVRLPVSLLF